MKAIFIDGNCPNPLVICPKEGEVVTVSQCPCRDDCYDVAEYPVDKNGHPQSIAKFRFIPLSSIDETEMQRNYQTQTA